MQLKDFFLVEYIIDGFEASDKAEALKAISVCASKVAPNLEQEEIYQTILERENIGSTGIGDGVAIPHAKFASVEKPILLFFRSRNGVMFDAQDNKPVYFIFLVIAPEGASPLYLKLLARIAKLIRRDDVVSSIKSALNPHAIYELILDIDEKMGQF